MSHQPNPDHQANHYSIGNQQPLHNQVNHAEFEGGLEMEGSHPNTNKNSNAVINQPAESSVPYAFMSLIVLGIILTFVFLHINQQKPSPKIQQALGAIVEEPVNTYQTSPVQSYLTPQPQNNINESNIAANHKIPKALKEALANPANATKLQLSRKKLLALPESIGTLYNLQKLYLTRNELKYLPRGFTRLQKLTHLYARYNWFKKFPQHLLALPNLTHLYLTGNKIRKIPMEISQMQGLQSLHLSDNRLKSLPESITQLKNLRRLYLKGNPINAQEREKIKNWFPHCLVVFD